MAIVKTEFEKGSPLAALFLQKHQIMEVLLMDNKDLFTTKHSAYVPWDCARKRVRNYNLL